MKYYNKEWYDLMQKANYTTGIEAISDKDYTNEDIEELYNNKLNEYIQEEKQSYNQEPDFSVIEQLLNEQEFDSENWLFVDEKTKETLKPSSKEEVIKHLEQEKIQAVEEFNNRKPFNEKKAKKEFAKMYKEMLKCEDTLPSWVYQKVDKRLIALGLLPRSIFNKLQAEENKNKEKFENIINKAQKELDKQNIEIEIQENFHFHDGILKSFKKKDNDIIMTINCPDSFENIIKTVVFKNAEIIEMENVKNRKSIYLYEEIYFTKSSYEVHMMFECNGLKYITLKCEDIEIK